MGQKESKATIVRGSTQTEERMTAEVSSPSKETIRTFEVDWRNNPKLHNLYVRGAYTDLSIAKNAICALRERSRTSAHAMAQVLQEAMVAEIVRDAAFFEAAALLFAELPPPKDPDEATPSEGEEEDD